MAAPAAAQAQIPFTAAAHRYREKFFTKASIATSTANQDISPTGNAIKSYGYLRAVKNLLTASTAGSGGNLAADAPWNIFQQLSVTQPNGEEMYGGPTFSGYHAFQAAKHSGWKLANDPSTLPSFANSATSPAFVLPIVFEMNAQNGAGSLPNQDFSAPWKYQLTCNTTANIWQTAPTTNPTLQVDMFIDCWTVPQAVNPLNPQIRQQVAPELLGSLNKWTLQTYALSASSSQNILLNRKGNAVRNLGFIVLNSSSARIAITNLVSGNSPFSFRWDGTNIRSSDDVRLVLDDEYATRGGEAGSTAVTADTGVIFFQMADLAGVDTQGVAGGYGMNAFWGTVQSSTIEFDTTTGGSAANLQVLTNDVQFVNLAGNPYAFAYAGYLQAPAQPSARS